MSSSRARRGRRRCGLVRRSSNRTPGRATRRKPALRPRFKDFVAKRRAGATPRAPALAPAPTRDPRGEPAAPPARDEIAPPPARDEPAARAAAALRTVAEVSATNLLTWTPRPEPPFVVVAPPETAPSTPPPPPAVPAAAVENAPRITETPPDATPGRNESKPRVLLVCHRVYFKDAIVKCEKAAPVADFGDVPTGALFASWALILRLARDTRLTILACAGDRRGAGRDAPLEAFEADSRAYAPAAPFGARLLVLTGGADALAAAAAAWRGTFAAVVASDVCADATGVALANGCGTTFAVVNTYSELPFGPFYAEAQTAKSRRDLRSVELLCPSGALAAYCRRQGLAARCAYYAGYGYFEPPPPPPATDGKKRRFDVLCVSACAVSPDSNFAKISTGCSGTRPLFTLPSEYPRRAPRRRRDPPRGPCNASRTHRRLGPRLGRPCRVPRPGGRCMKFGHRLGLGMRPQGPRYPTGVGARAARDVVCGRGHEVDRQSFALRAPVGNKRDDRRRDAAPRRALRPRARAPGTVALARGVWHRRDRGLPPRSALRVVGRGRAARGEPGTRTRGADGARTRHAPVGAPARRGGRAVYGRRL